MFKMQGQNMIAVVFSSNGSSQHTTLPPGISSYDEFVDYVRKAFKQPQKVQLEFTNGQQDINCDEHVQQLQPGQRVLVHLAQQGNEQTVFKERISFNPHPKTLTMAGDYEYFAAQGHHPLAFAVAELIDNALRATKGNTDRPRSIAVSFVTDEKGSKGMVCVKDNGLGMTVQELNNWAVMNLSMEDRGLLSTEEEKVGNRYLSSDISYFGVGSKNAAFYLGKTVKVVTKTDDSSYVHELCIQAAELERRYREGQVVYEEEMLHRQPGDMSSLATAEQSFTQPQQLLQDEVATANGSFTRILVYDLKPEVMGQLCDEDEGAGILRDLAHLYHYYLHGAKGNPFTSTHASVLPNGEKVPDILVERVQGSELCWSKLLVDVDDDLESRYLAAKRDQLEFVLSLPSHGRVEGVLWYFPYENDQETVPLDPHTMGRMLLTSHREGATQQHPAGGGQGAFTQVAPSQLAALQSQKGHGTQRGKQPADLEAEQDAGYAALLAACPTFEAFWQGRLIPGACVDTLPFIRSVRSKRTAAAKDLMPDELFYRIRGALFFGPSFRVTRNKLTFRDNLAMLLEAASPTDRHLEKHFKEWLVNCHRQYDRSVKFEVLCHQSAQAHARKELGKDVTIFERISDGLHTISRGDIVRLNTKPAMIGKVEHFSVPQIVQCEGRYSGGSVTVRALPYEVLGTDNMHTWPLRRLEGLVSQEELQEHVNRELSKLPTGFRFEPLHLAKGEVISLPAGSGLPETSIAVINGAGNRIFKALIAGHRQQLKVVQTLYYLGPVGTSRKRTAAAAAQGGSQERATAVAAAAAEEPAKKGGKRGKKRRKGAAAAAEAVADEADKENEVPGATAAEGKRAASPPLEHAQEDYVPEGEVLLSVENKSPIHDTFQFQRITGGLTRSGCYCLLYSLVPELPAGRTLRFAIDLQVTAGPPVSFDIRGGGRAVALSKSIMLGEALPPLHLMLQDSHGNAVPADAAAWAERQLQLQVLQSSIAGGGAVLQELNVQADVEVVHDELCLKNVRVLGPASPAADGMQLFKPPVSDASGATAAVTCSQRGAAPGPASSLPVVRSVDVYLAAHIEGLLPQGFPIRLAPGAPHSVKLLHGHPFCKKGGDQEEDLAQQLMTQLAPEQHLAPAVIMSGEQLPTFKVQTLDVWGNATSPNDVLDFEVALQCTATDPQDSTFSVDDRGVATVSGLAVHRQGDATLNTGSQAADAAADNNQQHKLVLRPQCKECEQPLMQPALEVAQPQQQLELQLTVQPSHMPAELVMLHQGEEMGRRFNKVMGDDGEEDQLVWQLTGVEAGSRVEGLAVRCVDEIGRPAAGGVRGRIQVSWAKGSKKAALGCDDIRLPSLQAPDEVGQAVPYWVRFIGDPKEWPGASFDINFEVTAAPGAPASWSCKVVNYRDRTDASHIPCGQPFYLEIEALDACNNRCCFNNAEDRPTPVVVAEAEDPEAQLQLDPDAWQHKWDNTQAGGDVCLYKLWMAGPPGPVKLIVRDNAGEDGASLLTPDELPIELLPGPAAALVADCSQQLECGTKGLLETLPIKVVDSYGNLVEDASFEISLNGSAFNAEGVPARVSASGSNRTKLRNGVATFKSVRIAAPSEGVYKLTVGSVSKKVVVLEAMVLVQVRQQNYVNDIQILAASIPAEGSCTAGNKLQVLVTVETENQESVPWEAVSGGLTLSLAPPAGLYEATEGAKKGKSSKARKADVMQLIATSVLAADQEGLDPVVVEEATAAARRGCVVCFETPELTVAGQYTLTAAYTESRAELLPGLSKQEQSLRSTSLQFQVAAGHITSAALQAANADQETLTVSNGKEPSQRRLLKNAAVQLIDSFGNPALVPEVPVRWRLLCDDAGSCSDDAQAPELCCSNGPLQLNSDERGRAFFGDLAIEQDTGRMPAGASQSLQCTLEAQVLMPKAKGRRSGGSISSTWVTIWQCQVLFSDDAARIRELQALQEQKEQVQQQLRAVAESVQEVQHRLQGAQKEHQEASKSANQQLQVLRQRLRQPDLQLPSNVSDAQRLLEQVKAKAAQQVERPTLTARFGSARHNMTIAIQKLLQQGDPDLVGVFAQLGYVDEPRLSAVLASNYAGAMQVMVVKTYEAIARLRKAAQQANVAIPSMLSYTLIQEYSTEEAYGGNVQMQGISELAQQLVAEACQGTDPPLPMPLPHTRQLTLLANSNRALPKSEGYNLAVNQWPPGCLGFAVNLVRPAISNTRRGVMYAQLGRTLVFETLDAAAAYRQYVIHTLRSSTADVVTLDGNKLSGRGVVMGSSFRVCSIEEAPFRFGTCPAGHQQASTQLSLTQCEAAAEAVIEALHQKDQAEQDLQAMHAELQQPQHQQLQQQQAELQQQLEQLQQQIRQQQRSIEGDNRRSGRPRQTQHPTDGEADVVDLAAAEAAETGQQQQPEGRQHRSKRRKV